MRNIAVIVLNFNGKRIIKKCLQSILDQKEVRIKLVVVDNNSTDGSLKLVKESFPKIDVISLHRNFGYGVGMNAGIKHVIKKFESIIFLDNDVILDKMFALNLTDVLFSKKEIGICTGLLLDKKGEIVNAIGGYFLNFLTGTLMGYFVGAQKNHVINVKPFEVFMGSGGVMVVKRELFKKIGLFDEKFFIYFEDVDLSWRAITSGYKVFCCPSAYVRHYVSTSAKQIRYESTYHMEKNHLLVYYKNLSRWALIFILPIVFLFRLSVNFYVFLINKDFRLLKSRLKGIMSAIISFSKFRKERKMIQNNRKLSDQELIRKPFIKFQFLKLISKPAKKLIANRSLGIETLTPLT